MSSPGMFIASSSGWMIYGQKAFLACLADPVTAVRDFDCETTELFHQGADLRDLGLRAHRLKTGQPLPGSDFETDDGAERAVGLTPTAFEDPQRPADLLPNLRAITAGAEKLRWDVEAALEELEAARPGIEKGGGSCLLAEDFAAAPGRLNLLLSVMRLMPCSLLWWSDSA